MMDWTDRHCRVFHRQFSKSTLLYTEMVTAAALVRGGAGYLLDHSPCEHPLALQLGGSEPGLLARAVDMAAPLGFCEINLNVGCPSDKVRTGCFGAVLLQDPDRVAELVAAMVAAAGPVPITVKCRIGVDEQDPAEILPAFIAQVRAAGAAGVIVHARKAWLNGLSPKENRDIPPLDYDLVHRMKALFPDFPIHINGGIASLAAAQVHLARGLDGVMIGRAAYHRPGEILGHADAQIFGTARGPVACQDAVLGMLPYIEAERGAGTPLHQITRHMLGAFSGQRGARHWRRILSEEARKAGAGPEVVERALKAVLPEDIAAA